MAEKIYRANEINLGDNNKIRNEVYEERYGMSNKTWNL